MLMILMAMIMILMNADSDDDSYAAWDFVDDDAFDADSEDDSPR